MGWWWGSTHHTVYGTGQRQRRVDCFTKSLSVSRFPALGDYERAFTVACPDGFDVSYFVQCSEDRLGEGELTKTCLSQIEHDFVG